MSMQGCVIRSFETFNTVQYILDTIQCIIRIRHMTYDTHPCVYVCAYVCGHKLQLQCVHVRA
jgi:hypothetical protein